MTSGKFRLGVANEGSLTLTPDSVTLVNPLLVTVTSKVSTCPTSTLPNRRIEGECVSCGAFAKTFGDPKANSTITPKIRKMTGK